MSKWNKLANKESIDKATQALKANGIEAVFVETAEEAKKEVLARIPEGSEVMTMTSVTLDTLGLPKEINESAKFNSARNKLNSMDRNTQNLEMQKLGAAPEWAIGSAHAITEEGQIIIASQTGSQLSAYAGGSPNVIWIAGAQKIVKDTDKGIKRIYEYVLPQESERAKKAYGVSGSNVSKLLIVNKEVKPGRIFIILVNEVLGF